ncbi:SDR family NAD(P)-dependent oxidoreductase [Salinispira pacifica]
MIRQYATSEAANPAPEETFCLVTGASSGIGLAIAEECARLGLNLFMVALPRSGLVEQGARIAAESGVRVETFECDLTEAHSIHEIRDRIRSRGYRIRVLVNNAGVDIAGRFDDRPLADHEQMVGLNILAVMRLTYLLLPMLKLVPNAHILNIASAAAFFPMPYKPIYSPSKTFVMNFSFAIREELRGTGISVSVVCPGGVITNEDVRARIKLQGLYGRLSSMEPSTLARYTLPRVFRGQALIVPGWFNKLFQVLGWIVPLPILLPYLHHRFRRDEALLRTRPNTTG